MKATAHEFGLVLGLGAVLVLGGGAARAQQEQAQGPQGPSGGESSSATEQQKPALEEQPRYVLLLGSDQVVTLNEKIRHRLLYGMSLSAGYDDGIVPGQTPTGVVYTQWNPRVGFLGQRPRFEYIFQYAPSVSYFSRSVVGTRLNHETDLHMRGEFNRGWGWDFGLTGRYGSYAASLLSPFRFTTVGGVAAVDPNRVIPDEIGNRLDTQATLGLRWRPSLRTTVTLGGSHNYAARFETKGFALPGHLNRSAAALTVEHAITRRVGVVAVADATRSFGAAVPCVRYGGSLGLALHPTRRLDLFGAVGPEFGNASCLGNRLVAYHGFGTYRISSIWTFYAAGQRSVAAPVRLAGAVLTANVRDQITQNFAAGIARQAVGGRLQLRLDAGYLDTQFGLGGLIRLEHGTYVSPMIGWRLTPTLTAVATYRRVFQSITGLTQGRNQFALTLDWRPDNPERGLTRP